MEDLPQGVGAKKKIINIYINNGKYFNCSNLFTLLFTTFKSEILLREPNERI